MPQTAQIYFLNFEGWKVQDQSSGRIQLLVRLSSWITDRCLLAMSSHDREWFLLTRSQSYQIKIPLLWPYLTLMAYLRQVLSPNTVTLVVGLQHEFWEETIQSWHFMSRFSLLHVDIKLFQKYWLRLRKISFSISCLLIFVKNQLAISVCLFLTLLCSIDQFVFH